MAIAAGLSGGVRFMTILLLSSYYVEAVEESIEQVLSGFI
jgi:hypothetical protein